MLSKDFHHLTIKNSETGRTEKVQTFAIRTNQDTFRKIWEDKTDDDLIDHAIVGQKDARKLAFTYEFDVLSNNMITNW